MKRFKHLFLNLSNTNSITYYTVYRGCHVKAEVLAIPKVWKLYKS